MLAITLPDVAGVIPCDEGVFGLELLIYFVGFLDELGHVLEEWRDTVFIWCKIIGELQNNATAVADFVFSICGGKDGKEEAFNTDGRFDDVGDKV